MATILDKLTIEELSAVDNPAQQGAKAVIMKRGNGIDEKGGAQSFRKKSKADDKKDGAGEMDEEKLKAELEKSSATVTAIAKAYGISSDEKDVGDAIAKAIAIVTGKQWIFSFRG